MRTAMLTYFVVVLSLGTSLLLAQEPILEPIPLPAPETHSDGEIAPTVATRTDDDESGEQAEQASFDAESELQPIPTGDSPIILQSPVIESVPVESQSFESAPPNTFQSHVIEPSTIVETQTTLPTVQAPIINQPAIVESVPTHSSPARESCICTQGQRVQHARPAAIEYVQPRQRTVESYGVQQKYEVPQRTLGYPVRRPANYAVRTVDPRSMQPVRTAGYRYDNAGPYTVRRSTEVRPGPGRNATHVTTYEITRYRPVTFQVALPPQPMGYTLVPDYQLPGSPPVPMGPVRSLIRRW